MYLLQLVKHNVHRNTFLDTASSAEEGPLKQLKIDELGIQIPDFGGPARSKSELLASCHRATNASFHFPWLLLCSCRGAGCKQLSPGM